MIISIGMTGSIEESYRFHHGRACFTSHILIPNITALIGLVGSSFFIKASFYSEKEKNNLCHIFPNLSEMPGSSHGPTSW